MKFLQQLTHTRILYCDLYMTRVSADTSWRYICCYFLWVTVTSETALFCTDCSPVSSISAVWKMKYFARVQCRCFDGMAQFLKSFLWCMYHFILQASRYCIYLPVCGQVSKCVLEFFTECCVCSLLIYLKLDIVHFICCKTKY